MLPCCCFWFPFFFFSSRRRHTRSLCDWSSDVCSSDLYHSRCDILKVLFPMPELPEVETVARGLRQAVLGRRILSVALGKTDFIDDPAALEEHLPGRAIEAIERYGKFMLLRLTE